MGWTDHEASADRLTRLSASLAAACANPSVTGVWVNPQDGRVRLNTWDLGHVPTADVCDAGELESWLNVVATAHGVEFGPDNPRIAAELPAAGVWRGARLQAFGPPVTDGYSVVIRKHPTHAPTLAEYVAKGILSARRCETLSGWIEEKKTGVVAGPTNSGKTTLLGACLRHVSAVCPEDRLVLIEDTSELICSAADYLPLRTAPGAGIGFNELLRDSLRVEPTRIICGEIRGAEALTFLDAASTGHPGGLCTMHAGSVRETLHRLDRLAQRANVPPQPELVGEAVDFVVVLNGGNNTRRVVDLALVTGFTTEAGFCFTTCPE